MTRFFTEKKYENVRQTLFISFHFDDIFSPKKVMKICETKIDPSLCIESNHPYAKVKKIRDHPYATVNKSDGSSAPSTSTAAPPIPPPPPEVELRPQPQAQQQYFSGDSQDSSKGYTSISVREPLRHIRTTMPNQDRSGSMSNQQNYAAVSEASDDMYAAIEDPTYIPTGNQSNSDTYAVIQLPEEIDEIDASYSQVDKSRKRNKAPPAPAGAAGGASAKNASSSESNNVNDMYAKVHKNRGEVDNLPMGASAMRTSKEHLLGGADDELPEFTLKMNEEGSLMYIPSPDFNGSDAFMYTSTDIDGTTSTGSVSIDVKSVNDHPLVICCSGSDPDSRWVVKMCLLVELLWTLCICRTCVMCCT